MVKHDRGSDVDKARNAIQLHTNAMWQWHKFKHNCQDHNCCESKVAWRFLDQKAVDDCKNNVNRDKATAIWSKYRKNVLAFGDEGTMMSGGDLFKAKNDAVADGARWVDVTDSPWPVGTYHSKWRCGHDEHERNRTRTDPKCASDGLAPSLNKWGVPDTASSLTKGHLHEPLFYAGPVWHKKWQRRYMATWEGGETVTSNGILQFVAAMVFQVTAWHKWSANNVPYMCTPQAGSTQMRWRDWKGELNTQGDVDAFYMSTAITILTSMRTPPLLGDWSKQMWGEHNIRWPVDDANANTALATQKAVLEHFRAWHRKYKRALVYFAIEVFNIDETQRSGFGAMSKRHSFPAFNPAFQEASVAI